MTFRLRLVLVGVEGEVNLGFIARLADNFDVDEIHLVAPRASVAAAARYAARAAARLNRARLAGSLEEALEGCSLAVCTSAIARDDDILRVPVAPWELAHLALQAGGTVALVMGRESVGLTRRELGLCDVMVHIPASPSYPELNLANATAILLYELYRTRSAPPPPRRLAPRSKIELMASYARRLAGAAPDRPRALEGAETLRRLAVRAGAVEAEVERLTYLLARAARRLGAGLGEAEDPPDREPGH